MDISAAALRLRNVIQGTPLQYHPRLSQNYHCDVYLKREDLQPVRSYKIRGAYNKISTASKMELINGVVCASAGNHAQGVAYTCSLKKLSGKIFMPANTPQQKIRRVKSIGGDCIEIFLTGESYDECADAALKYCKRSRALLIHPFDDIAVIEGQGTIALELLEDKPLIDYLLLPVGGGGLAAGISYHFQEHSPQTVLVGLEPAGAPSMTAAFEAGKSVWLQKIDPFVDGAAVQQVGNLTYDICKNRLHHMQTVPEGKICAALLSLYNDDGIVTEAAGALAIAGLDNFAEQIKGKTVVCIVSGSNNDSNRMDDIKKLADEWEGLQHWLVIRFHHNPDGLSQFFTSLLCEGNHVTRMEYNRRDHGRSTYALVGIRSSNTYSYIEFTKRLRWAGIEHKEVTKEDFLFKYWV